MKKSLMIMTIALALWLWWCLWTKPITQPAPQEQLTSSGTISPQAQELADRRITGNETCDNYLHTIQCIAKKWWEDNQFTKNYDSIVDSLQNLPVDQLQETCTTLTTSLQEDPSILIYNADCNSITNTGNVESGATTSGAVSDQINNTVQ